MYNTVMQILNAAEAHIYRLESAGEAFEQRLGQANTSLLLQEQLARTPPLLKGMASELRGYHSTLPVFVPKILTEGLSADGLVLSEELVGAANAAVERFSERGFSHMRAAMKVSGSFKREDSGLVYVTTEKEHADFTLSSYGFPELASTALATVVRATKLTQHPRCFTGPEIEWHLGLVNKVLDGYLQGKDSTKSVVVILPETPGFLDVMLERIGDPDKLEDNLRTSIESGDYLPHLFSRINLGIPGPIPPQYIESVYETSGPNFRTQTTTDLSISLI